MLLVAAAACRSAGPPAAPVPAPTELPTPAPVPAPTPSSAFSGDTLEWVVAHGGRITGRMRQWGDTGFTTVSVYVPRLRGTALRLQARTDRTHLPTAYTLTGVDEVEAPRTETVTTSGGVLAFRTEAGVARSAAGRGFPYATSGHPELDAMLARALLATTARTLALVPDGRATLTTVGERPVAGATLTTTATLHLLRGVGLHARPIWLDASGALFARVDASGGTIRRGFEGAVARLVAVQDSALSAGDSSRTASAVLRTAGPLIVRHARVFDPRSRRLAPDRAIVIRGDRIAAVVADSALVLPAGATVIDARGQVVLPGLRDLQARADGGDAALHLAAGVTRVRMIATDPAAIDALRRRWEHGGAPAPRLDVAGLVEGPGPDAAATPMVAPSPDSSRALVRRWRAAGATSIALGAALDARTVAALVREAHASGLPVHGAPPLAVPVERLLRDGVDEVHAVERLAVDMLVGGRRPDDDAARLATVVARAAAAIDPAAGPARAVVTMLRERGVTTVPLLAVAERRLTTPAGQLPVGLGSFATRLPPVARAALRGGGLAVASPADRRRHDASFTALQRITKALYDAEVPLGGASGDQPGSFLHRDLELQARAGIPNTDVLAAATLGAARRLGVDSLEGVVAPGMRADLVIVDGDPTVHMAMLRRTTLVIVDGVAVRPDRLLAGLGIAPEVASLAPLPSRATASPARRGASRPPPRRRP